MALNFKLAAVAALLAGAISIQAAYYPMWLTPVNAEDVGVQLMQNAGNNLASWKATLSKLRFNIENYPESPNRWWYAAQLADGLYEINELEPAITWYKVLENLPDSTTMAKLPGMENAEAAHTTGRLGLARCYVQLGDTINAVKYINAILPRHDADRVMLAELQFQLNRRNAALKLLQETEGVNITDNALKLRMVQMYRAMKMYPAANQLLTSVVNSTGNSPADVAMRKQAKDLLRFAQFPHSTNWADGRFEGTAETADGKLTLEVTIKNGGIERITYQSKPTRTPWSAYESMTRRIIRDKYLVVDPVIGAEETCGAIQTALFMALNKARRN